MEQQGEEEEEEEVLECGSFSLVQSDEIFLSHTHTFTRTQAQTETHTLTHAHIHTAQITRGDPPSVWRRQRKKRKIVERAIEGLNSRRKVEFSTLEATAKAEVKSLIESMCDDLQATLHSMLSNGERDMQCPPSPLSATPSSPTLAGMHSLTVSPSVSSSPTLSPTLSRHISASTSRPLVNVSENLSITMSTAEVFTEEWEEGEIREEEEEEIMESGSFGAENSCSSSSFPSSSSYVNSSPLSDNSYVATAEEAPAFTSLSSSTSSLSSFPSASSSSSSSLTTPSWSSIAEEHVRVIQSSIDRHHRQLKYISDSHERQRKKARLFLTDSAESDTVRVGAEGRSGETKEGEADGRNSEADSMREGVRETGRSSVISLDCLVAQAVREGITGYPQLFVPSDSRKLSLVRNSLHRVISHDPNAVSMRARADVCMEMKRFWREVGDSFPTMEALLERYTEGAYTGRYFPCAAKRQPFSSMDSASIWVERILRKKMKDDTWQVPTLQDCLQSFEKGKNMGMDVWYHTFHQHITDLCLSKQEEIAMFTSLVATCSPNSGISQNSVNALLNFRAISQGLRPKWGSYPYRNMVNYLTGCLGQPSGQKVCCFLDNLLHPHNSQSVAIDTHMQAFLLGEGHKTLSPIEYAVLEDYIRTVTQEIARKNMGHNEETGEKESLGVITDALTEEIYLESTQTNPKTDGEASVLNGQGEKEAEGSVIGANEKVSERRGESNSERVSEKSSTTDSKGGSGGVGARHVDSLLPHNVQSSIWCSIAGVVTLHDAILSHSHTLTLSLQPDAEELSCIQEYLSTNSAKTRENGTGSFHGAAKNSDSLLSLVKDEVLTLQQAPENINNKEISKLANLVCEKLLELGYLNSLQSIDGFRVSIRVIVPLRDTSSRSLMSGHLNMRKSYAKRQGRDLLPSELQEAVAASEHLTHTQNPEQRSRNLANEPGHKSKADIAWWERDMNLIRAWTLNKIQTSRSSSHTSTNTACKRCLRAEKSKNSLCCIGFLSNVASFYEIDPYFSAHQHFEGDMKTFSVIFIEGLCGGLWLKK